MSPRQLRALCLVTLLAMGGYLGLSLWAGWQTVAESCWRVGGLVFGAALALSLVNYTLRFGRWQYYLAVLGATVPWRASLSIYLSGFALTATPGKAGEGIRTLLLKPYGMSASSSLAAFFAERFSDFLAIVLMSCLGMLSYAPAREVVTACLAGILVVLAALHWPRLLDWLTSKLRVQSSGRGAKLATGALATVSHFRRCFTGLALLLGLAIGLVSWGAEALGMFLILRALGAELGFAMVVFIYAFSMLVGALSFLPGGLGGTEAVMTGLLVLNGLGYGESVAATILVRIATLWFAVLLGLVALARHQHGGMSAAGPDEDTVT